jgi:hypothetical protein
MGRPLRHHCSVALVQDAGDGQDQGGLIFLSLIGRAMQFFSQVGQDRFLFENFFYGKRNGTFVDIGAYDGEKFSNSLFFERYMGWHGLCVEPLPSAFARLAAKRQASICKQVCIADFEGEADFTEADAGIDEKMLSGLTQQFDPRHVDRLKRVSTNTVHRKVQVRTLSSCTSITAQSIPKARS